MFPQRSPRKSDFVKAFANSCNGAFSSLGLVLDLNRFHSTAEELLFNNPLPLSGYSYKESSFNMKEGAEPGRFYRLHWPILQELMRDVVVEGTGSSVLMPIRWQQNKNMNLVGKRHA